MTDDVGLDRSGAFIGEQVALYRAALPLYSTLARVLEASLTRAAAARGFQVIVQSRTKTIPSFAEKCVRKRAKHAQPAYQFTDLCGARVIVESARHVRPMCDFIRSAFQIDEGNSEDLAERLAATQFGYQSVHFIVALDRELATELVLGETLEVPDELFATRDAAEARALGLVPGPRFKAEIQVRTLLQHAWATSVHDSLYKSDMKTPPRHLVRESGRIAAALENADASLVQLVESFRAYRSWYGRHLTEDDFVRERDVLRAVLAFDPSNEQVAQRLARLVLARGDWAQAYATLMPFAQSQSASVRRDLGVAGAKCGHTVEARHHLEVAVAADESDADAQCALGDTYLEVRDYASALPYYEAAFRARPTYPRALQRYILAESVVRSQLDFLPLMSPNLAAAIETSRELARAGVHLPFAYYEIGFFQLLLRREYECLTAYAKALQLTTPGVDGDGLIAESLAAPRELLRVAHARGTELTRYIEWVVSLLEVALKARHFARGGRRDRVGGTALRPPVVIVAGGCHPSTQARIEDYRASFRRAFEGFRGTILSGGTTAGVAGLVGELPNPERSFTRVGYLPSNLPPGDVRDHRYEELRETSEHWYTPQDTLTMWQDLVASGIRPTEVRVLGINGGRNSALEFRLALALGAIVGVVRDSGREASALTNDPDWSDLPQLAPLPTDPETIAAFVQPPPRWHDDEARERMAQHLHGSYCTKHRARLLEGDPALAPWENLDPAYRNSNLAQVDQIFAKLRRIGLAVHRPPPDQPIVHYRFTSEQVATLAEMEHGRFTAERLCAGWRLDSSAKKSDPVRRTSPHLVSWAQLSDEAREWTRSQVQLIPQQLAGEGYEIFEPAPQTER